METDVEIRNIILQLTAIGALGARWGMQSEKAGYADDVKL